MFAALALAAGALVVGAAPAEAVGPCDDPVPPPQCSPSEGPPAGRLDSITRVPTGIRVVGWAADPDHGALPVKVLVDDVLAGQFTADKPYPGHDNSGCEAIVPAKSGSRVCLMTLDYPKGSRFDPVCQTCPVRFDAFGSFSPIVRSGTGVQVSGWAIDPDTAKSVSVVAQVDGAPDLFFANLPRAGLPGLRRRAQPLRPPRLGGAYG